jgi:hypothetical protein
VIATCTEPPEALLPFVSATLLKQAAGFHSLALLNTTPVVAKKSSVPEAAIPLHSRVLVRRAGEPLVKATLL